MGNTTSTPNQEEKPVRAANELNNSEISDGKIIGADTDPVKKDSAVGEPSEGENEHEKSPEEKVDITVVIRFTFSIFRSFTNSYAFY